MRLRTIQATRVNGFGKSKTVNITIGKERLHGSGQFSNVYSAKLYRPCIMNVAIKKTWPNKGNSSVINSEMYYLSRIKHPSIICLLYHFTISSGNNEVCHCLVFDFLPTDMSKLRMQLPGRRFDLLDAKLYAFQMFSGIDYVNSLGIAHRDVKPSNMIVDHELGILKIADFGNAKLLRSRDTNTSYQVTRYYRAPELVFGSNHYTTSIDVWACGCVLAEFVTGKVLLQGKKGDQPRLIIDVFGFPTSEQCVAMKISRPRYARRRARGLKVVLEGNDVSPELLALLSAILKYEPNLRMQGCEVLSDEFFDDLREIPPPVRTNGRRIPKLNYGIVEDETQSTE